MNLYPINSSEKKPNPVTERRLASTVARSLKQRIFRWQLQFIWHLGICPDREHSVLEAAYTWSIAENTLFREKRQIWWKSWWAMTTISAASGFPMAGESDLRPLWCIEFDLMLWRSLWNWHTGNQKGSSNYQLNYCLSTNAWNWVVSWVKTFTPNFKAPRSTVTTSHCQCHMTGPALGPRRPAAKMCRLRLFCLGAKVGSDLVSRSRSRQNQPFCWWNRRVTLPPMQIKASLGGCMVVNNPLIRPNFLGWEWHWREGTLGLPQLFFLQKSSHSKKTIDLLLANRM